SSDGLWAADCGIGIHEAGDAAPWGADIIATGLHDAAFLVEACEGARAASRWSARTATLGASLAAFLAFRPLPGTGLRVGTAVNGAALVTMAGTTRAAMALAQRPRPLPRDPTPWHALDPRAALERTGSSLDGLDPAEAARRRPARQGAVPAPLRLARDMADELVNPLTPILAVGAGLSLVTGAPVDAAMVGGVVALNAVIGGVQQFRADEAFAALERVGARRAIVRRGGEESVVDAESLVPGDVVRLRAGDAVPADLRILSTEWLEVDESSLTGESLPVTKDAEPTFALTLADRTSMLYDGSSVAAGEALAVVVATGSATEARRAGGAGHRGRGPPPAPDRPHRPDLHRRRGGDGRRRAAAPPAVRPARRRRREPGGGRRARRAAAAVQRGPALGRPAARPTRHPRPQPPGHRGPGPGAGHVRRQDRDGHRGPAVAQLRRLPRGDGGGPRRPLGARPQAAPGRPAGHAEAAARRAPAPPDRRRRRRRRPAGRHRRPPRLRRLGADRRDALRAGPGLPRHPGPAGRRAHPVRERRPGNRAPPLHPLGRRLEWRTGADDRRRPGPGDGNAPDADPARPAGPLRRPPPGHGAPRPRRRAGPEPHLPRLPGHRRPRPADRRRGRPPPAGGRRVGGDDHRRPPVDRRGHRLRARPAQRAS